MLIFPFPQDLLRSLAHGESCDSFLLRDDSGDCVVDPEYAEIATKHRDQWQEAELAADANPARASQNLFE